MTNPVASSAAAANPIESFMLESSMLGNSKMQARPVAGKGAKVHKIIYSYVARRRCIGALRGGRGDGNRS